MKTESIIDFLNSYYGSYEAVKELTINRFNIVGDILQVDLIDLLNFPNIESLTLINIIIDDKIIAIFTKLNNLSKLNLINCEIISSYIPTDLLHIKTLIIDNSNFEEYFNHVTLEYLELKNMKINCQQINTNVLKIDKSNIDLNKVNFSNIKHLIISETQFNNNKNLLCNNHLGIKLTVMDNVYDKVVTEYETI